MASPVWFLWTTKVDASVKVALRTEFTVIDPSARARAAEARRGNRKRSAEIAATMREKE